METREYPFKCKFCSKMMIGAIDNILHILENHVKINPNDLLRLISRK